MKLINTKHLIALFAISIIFASQVQADEIIQDHTADTYQYDTTYGPSEPYYPYYSQPVYMDQGDYLYQQNVRNRRGSPPYQN